MDHLWLKAIHILSATLVFGTGLSIAFFMWFAHRTGNARLIAATARGVVVADAIFTAPGVIGLLATGFAMAGNLGVPILRGWLAVALALFVFIGCCWLPVLWLQARAWRLAARAAAENAPLPASYRRTMAWWFWLGWPAFLAVVAVAGLMVLKPAL